MTDPLAPTLDIPGHIHACLQRKIEAGVRAAFAAGLDFVHGPIGVTAPNLFEPISIFGPLRYAIEVTGGPVLPGLAWPPTWTVYRVASITDEERARLAAGREDWREADWEDHCGQRDCATCDGQEERA